MLMQISWRADGTNFLAEQGLEDDILWRLNAVHADRDANLILDEIHHAEIHVQPDLRLWIGLLERGDMLTRGVDVLILTPVNGDSAGALVRKANRAKVPVVDYNFLALKADVACFIGRDAVQMAESIAQAAVKQAPTGNYILALGEESTSVAQEERKGYLNVLKPYVELGEDSNRFRTVQQGLVDRVGSRPGRECSDKVKNNVAAVVCANDGTAYGAIQALQAQGLAGKVFVNGVDAEPRAQELIRQGLMTLSNFTDFWQSGVEAADAAVKLAKGEKIETGSVVNNGLKDVPWIKVINFNVTKENLEEDTKKYPWWFATSAMK